MSTRFADKLSTIEKVIAVAAAGGLAFTTFKANTIANEVALQNHEIARQKEAIDGISRHQELELSARREARAESKEVNELTHKIFDEFVDALKDRKSDPEIFIDRMSGVLVLADAIPDAEQRVRMAQAVQQAIGRIAPPDAAAAAQLEELRFDAEDVAVRAEAQQKEIERSPEIATAAAVANAAGTGSTIKWGNYDFDIFWCEGADSANNQVLATKIADLRAQDPKASGRWRLRPLPDAVNRRPGYNVSGIQVRVSSEDERPLAQQLIASIQKLGVAQATIKPTVQKTPWYLSVFVCGAGGSR
jgi:hypothetical protein